MDSNEMSYLRSHLSENDKLSWKGGVGSAEKGRENRRLIHHIEKNTGV